MSGDLVNTIVIVGGDVTLGERIRFGGGKTSVGLKDDRRFGKSSIKRNIFGSRSTPTPTFFNDLVAN